MKPRAGVLSIAVVILAALATLPVLAADPSGSPSADPSASGSPSVEPSVEQSVEPSVAASPEPSPSPAAAQPHASPSATAKAPKPDKPAKAEKPKGNAAPVTLTGVVGTATDEAGRTTYTLRSGGTTYDLEAGPPWFWGSNHPLRVYVGETVTIAGSKRADATEVEVETVNGSPIREPGKPPWAGGWKVVGSAHPGWSQEKWDRWQAKRAEKAAKFGGCWPPGHCKEAGAAASPGAGPD